MSPQHANRSGQQLYEPGPDPAHGPDRPGRPDTGPQFESVSYASQQFEPAAHTSARYDDYYATPQAGRPFLSPEPGQPYGRPRKSRSRPAMSRAALQHAIGYPLVALIMLMIGLGIGGARDDDPVTAEPAANTSSAGTSSGGDDADAEPEGASEPEAGIGDPVRDGTFRFTVTKVKTGVKRVGDSGRGQEAQGRFVLVSLTVQNVGDEARAFDGSAQALYDAEGNEYDGDTEAAGRPGAAESFPDDVEPGAKVKGVVVFDVPEDFRPAKIELRDSPSGGVDVVLP